jgi:hypothetical protein
MDIYHVGDMIPSSPMFALLEEYDYCDNCSATIEFFVACSYGIYLGVFQSYRQAKERINGFGVEELLKLYTKRVPSQKGMWDESPIRFMERVVNFYESPPKREETKLSARLLIDDFKDETALEAIKNYLKQDELARVIKRLYAERIEFDIAFKMIDTSVAEVYNQKVQSALGRDYLFKIIKITDRKESVLDEENWLVTYNDLDENVIVDRVQYWLDTNRIPLQVICKEV